MGGYQVIDLKDTAFTTGTAKSVPGIYGLIEGTRKVILFVNIQLDGVEYHDAFVDLTGTPYTGSVYGYDINITSGDLVTFTKHVEA